MVEIYWNITLKVFGLGVICAAASFWAATGVDTRHNYRDEQTLIGGMIWSQFLIPLGLVISMSIGEALNSIVHSYFLLSGVAMCGFTSVVLLVGEYKAMKKNEYLREQIRENNLPSVVVEGYNKFYLIIGVLSLVAGSITLADFLLLVFY